MTVESGSIREDEPNTVTGYADDDAATDAFLSNLSGESKGSTEGGEQRDEAAVPAATEEPAKGFEETSVTTPEDPDDAEVEVKVGEETHKAKLKDLKRLFGQEASLTQKSQKLAETQRLADAVATKADATLKGLIAKAKAAYEPYEKLDMLVLSQRMDTDAFAQLREDAASAKANLDYLTTELDGHTQAVQARNQQAFQEAAQACIKSLEDPKTGIQGFGKELYEDIAKFAEAEGLTGVRQLTSAPALKLIHMAMQFKRGEAAAKAAGEKTTKVIEQAKRVLKPGTGTEKNSDSLRDAVAKLRRSGSDDDTIAAFMALG